MASNESSDPAVPAEVPEGASTRATAQLVHTDAPPAAQDIRDAIIIKEGDLFLLTDLEGNVARDNPNGMGLYFEDQRFLSTYALSIQGLRPTILLSTSRTHFLSSQVLTNPNLPASGDQVIHEQTIQIRRHRMLTGGGLRESLTIENFNAFPLELALDFHVGADFIDIFDVRGLVFDMKRPDPEAPVLGEDQIRLARRGIDGVLRSTTIRFSPAPTSISGDQIRFVLRLKARGQIRLDVAIDIDTSGGPVARTRPADRARLPLLGRWLEEEVAVEVSHADLQVALNQARVDLRLLLSGEGEGKYLAAGTPWYSTLFGRDTLITALQYLWMRPSLAASTLRLLASYQGTKVDPWRDETPGKILHELRRGDLAGSGLAPFNPYYGTVDATPLWIILLGEYYQVTGDLTLVRELEPNLQAALRWIDEYGDLDGDGFIEYHQESGSGLANQGWKDSWDAVVHADGTLADAPIALVEVQAYVFAAKRHAAMLLATLGAYEQAWALDAQARELQTRFDEAFWMEPHDTYCLALDKEKRQVGAVASNAGHALWCGIVPPEKASRVAARLMQEDMHSGWGIRTLSTRERRYNPAGYHVGTVWPHDNSLIALGFGRYGQVEHLAALATGMLDSSRHFPDRRIPELFCGYARSAFGLPVRYPVACSPQAWAAASWAAVLQALLGLRFDAPARELRIHRPRLPPWLDRVSLRRLKVGAAEVDLRYERVGDHAAVDVVALRGDVRVSFVER